MEEVPDKLCGNRSNGAPAQDERSPENGSLTEKPSWPATFLLWMRRSQQRRALAELAMRNDYLLRDLGLCRRQALHEAAKPFWRR